MILEVRDHIALCVFPMLPRMMLTRITGSLPPSGSVMLEMAPFSPRASEANANQMTTTSPGKCEPGQPVQRKAKRVRLLLDARTELTDDELKVS